MSPKHTPGPWKAGHLGGQCHIAAHVEARQHPGAKGGCVYDPIFYPMEANADGGTSFVGIVSESGAEVVGTEYDELKISMADATLIAAAPDLLAVAKALVVFQADYEHKTQDTAPGNSHYAGLLMAVVKQAQLTIAKAEGR